MQNIPTIDINNAGQSQSVVDSVKKQMGSVPNIFATMAHSSAVLEGYLQFSGALSAGALSPALREQIALTVAGENACDYCASAHTFLANSVGVSQQEIDFNLRGGASDEKTHAILSYAREVVANKGVIAQSATESLKTAGVSNEELVEIIAHIGMNIFTNYFNHIAGTVIDFPVVNTKAA